MLLSLKPHSDTILIRFFTVLIRSVDQSLAMCDTGNIGACCKMLHHGHFAAFGAQGHSIEFPDYSE